ncbi:MAG: hypothetical protein DRO14_04695 [Thermoprotei archaeon]|nr:MAG: hypothetical protein DRO14_04695 [Thermoprotei archaeon]
MNTVENIRRAIREELTSGQAGVRKLLDELLLGVVLKDGSGSELSIYLQNLDIKLSEHRGDIVSAIQNTQPRLARLQIYDSATATWKNVADHLPVRITVDDVGLLKEGGSVNINNFPADYPDSGTHTRLENIKSVLDNINNNKLDIPISQIYNTIKASWDNNEIHGTPTPVSGAYGDNTIVVKSGGDIDFDPGGKYLKSVLVEIESPANGDYIKEIAYTNDTTRATIAKNIPLAYGSKVIEFTSPRFVPSGYWLEIIITLSSAKGITATTEWVW